MKALSIFFTLLSVTINLYAQQQDFSTVPDQSNTTLRLNVISPGISFEQRLFNHLATTVMLWTNIYQFDKPIDTKIISKNAMLTLEPRYYIDRNESFSGFYIGLPVAIGMDRKLFQFAPVCGFQDELNTYVFWNVSVGYGYKQVDLSKQLGVIGYFNIGFTIL